MPIIFSKNAKFRSKCARSISTGSSAECSVNDDESSVVRKKSLVEFYPVMVENHAIRIFDLKDPSFQLVSTKMYYKNRISFHLFTTSVARVHQELRSAVLNRTSMPSSILTYVVPKITYLCLPCNINLVRDRRLVLSSGKSTMKRSAAIHSFADYFEKKRNWSFSETKAHVDDDKKLYDLDSLTLDDIDKDDNWGYFVDSSSKGLRKILNVVVR